MKKSPRRRSRAYALDPVVRDAHALLRFLSGRKERLSPLLILTHDFPDPDAMASAFALQYLCEAGFGIRASIAYGGVVGRTENRAMMRLLQIPIRRLHRSDLKKFERVALVDTQPLFQNNSFPNQRRAAIVIDQHRSSRPPAADLSLINVDAGATSVILAQALMAARLPIPAGVATALAYGILTDTMNLYRADQPVVRQTFLRLLPHTDLRLLAKIQNPTRSRRFFHTLGRGIQSAMLCRGLLVSHLGEVENPDLVSQTADFFLTYQRARWALCTGRFKGRLHASFRTASLTADAGEILRAAFVHRSQAGGHGPIAGGGLSVGRGASETEWKDQEDALVARLRQRLRIPKKAEFSFPFREK